MVAVGGASLLLALICIAPLLLVLGSFIGVVPFDFNILLIAIPTAGIAVPPTAVALAAWNDVRLPRPVLMIDDAGIFDRRVTDAPVPWNEVKAATSLLPGRGGVVLELDSPTVGRANPFRAGTFLFERPGPGLLHIPVMSMTVPAARLAGVILELAERHGALVAEATAHERIRRHTKFL
jgi:hypothetical protein